MGNERERIPYEVKRTCVEMQNDGHSTNDIYDYYRKQVKHCQSIISFESSLRRWRKKNYASDETLNRGTYEGFTAHNATVQVSKTGDIVQAWIKQRADAFNPEDFISAIKGKIEKYDKKPVMSDLSENCLEIPLFDMHWGLNYFDYYEKYLVEVLKLINLHFWKKIYIPFGQDFFHNDSVINGQTTKGTQIEKVDMQKAVKEGLKFMCAIIDAAITQADEVNVVYSPGNHDKSISWMFMQILLERYGPTIVDDALIQRRVFSFGSNSIMIVHGDSKRATPDNLAHIFPVAFPEEFASAKIREVHAGHLHSETDRDVFGVMVRRCCTASQGSTWANNEDFVGDHKRFMLFDWSTDKLKAIYYI